ncbi:MULTISPECIES: hypothetical protein [unclassified Butyrivibrio]|nr:MULTISPECIES: hypothetical protein [unclassified Butyrivibrio]
MTKGRCFSSALYFYIDIIGLMEFDTTGSDRIEQKKHVEKMRKEFKNVR